jgi:hypothetical protein
MDYKQFIGQFFKEHETQSRDMELQNLIGILGSKQTVDYKARFERVIRAKEGELTEKELEQQK